MIVDFLKFLGEAKAKYAFVATYEFDPLFFERRILTTCSFESADRIVVFMDDGRYRELLAQGRQGLQFDRRYFVVPISCAQGVFHPKLYFAIGDKTCLASVGSNNCTASGTGHNFELISAIATRLGEESRSPRETLCASVFQLFRRIGRESGAFAKLLDAKVFDPIEDAFPWLDATQTPSDAGGVEVLSNFDASLWSQMMDRLGNSIVQKITFCAPFYDGSLSIVERAKSVWPNVKIEIIAQPNYSNLPSARLARLQEKFADIELLSATPHLAGRSVHAKAIAIETPDQTFWMTGSANISYAALAGGNREACLWFSTRQGSSEILKHDDLTFAPVNPNEFEEALIAEPTQSPPPPHGLQISAVRLAENNELSGSIQAPSSAIELSVKLVRLREEHPFLIRPIASTADKFVLKLEEEQCKSFDCPVLAYLQAKIEGETVLSNPVSVAQLSQLLRERDGVGQAGNRLNRIMESGEGIVAYADTLQGVDEAIDFYRNVNIRFDDGTFNGGRTAANWRGRDPFSGDVPESWLIGSRGGSVTELREAIWDFVERHISTKLQKHATRGNLNGLPNFMDIYRTLSGLLLTYNHRQLDGEAVIPMPYLTDGLQRVLSTLIGPRVIDDPARPGFLQAIEMNVGIDNGLIRDQLHRHRIAATAVTTVDEMIRIRSVALNCSPNDNWSIARRRWVSDWIAGMNLAIPSEVDLNEVGAEFRMAA